MTRRPTFADHLRQTLAADALQAWSRGEIASHLRHSAIKCGNRRAAKAFSRIKINAVSRAMTIIASQCDVDLDYVHGMPYQSVHCGLNGHKLHIPIHVKLPKPRRRSGDSDGPAKE